MEIDASPNANKVNDHTSATSFDWNQIQAGTVGPYTAGPNADSAGIVQSTFGKDAPVCFGGTDATASTNGQSIDSNTPPPPAAGTTNLDGYVVQSANVTQNSDLCTGQAALELVRVHDSGYDQFHYVLYQYFTRNPGATGSIVFNAILAGPLAGRCDDYLLEFNYNPNTNSVTYRALKWSPTGNAPCSGATTWGPGTWTDTNALVNSSVQSFGANTDSLDNGNAGGAAGTFIETATDLNLANILPETGTNGTPVCRTFTTAGYVAYHGNNGALDDFISYANPLTISNCNNVQVNKVASNGAITSNSNFQYVIDQADGKQVHDASLTGITNPGGTTATDSDASTASITSNIKIGQSQIWSGVTSSPDYRVTENSLPAGWTEKSVVCNYTDVFGGGAPNAASVIIYQNGAPTGNTFPIYPPQLAPAPVCTITNETTSITIVKDAQPDANQSFAFTSTIPGHTSFNLSDPAPGGTASSSTTFVGVAPGNYTVTESATSGWKNTALSCTDSSGGTTTTLATSTASIAVAQGDSIVCTYTNQINKATLTLKKAWVNGKTGDAVSLSASGDNSEFPPSSASGSSTVGGSSTDAVLTVYPGETVALSEAYTAGNAAGYNHSLACVDANNNPVSITYTGGALNGSIAFGATPGNVTCTFTNTRKQATLTVQKVWVNGKAGDTANLSASGTNNGSVLSTAPNGASFQMTVFSDEDINLSETLGLHGDTYTSGLACGGPSLGTTSGTYTVPTSPSNVTCTFTNSRTKAQLTLRKEWIKGANGDTASLVAGGSAPKVSTANGSASQLDTTNTVTIDVFSGDTVNLSEALGAQNKGSYTDALACDASGLATYAPGTLNGNYTMPATPANVTCTFTNTRREAKLFLKKAWLNGAAGDTAGLSISGDASASATSTATGGASQTDNTNVASVTVLSGDSITVGETLGANNVGSYTTTISCTNGAQFTYTPGALSGSLSIPGTPVDVTCTITNDRTKANLVLQKAWVNGKSGDTAALTAGAGGATSTSNGAAGTFTDTANKVTVSVFSGAAINLSEVLGAGNLGSYTSNLDCGAASLGTTSGTYTMPKVAANVTCTFTNTRTAANVTLQKRWINGAQGDSTLLTLGVGNTATSTANGSADFTDTGATVTASVLSGDSINFGEALTGNNVGSYTSTYICTGGTSATGTGGTFTMPKAAANATCTITNTRTSQTVTLQKAWVNGFAGDTTLLHLTGGVDATAVSPNGDGTSPQTVTATVLSGASFDFSEVLGAGNHGSYTSTWSCGGSPTAALSGSATMPKSPVAITCTFTNTRTSAVVHLEKSWVNGAQGDSTSLTLGGQAGSSVASGTLGAETDAAHALTTTVLSGDSVNFGETLAAGNTGGYSSSYTCGQGTTAGTSGSFTMPKTPVETTCIIINTRTTMNVVLQKAWAGAVQGDTADLSLVHASGTDSTTSTADGAAGLFTDTGNTVTSTVFSGETVTLNEALGADNTGSYKTNFSCSTDTGVTYGGNNAKTASLVIPKSVSETPITCTYTNSANRGTIKIVKNLLGDTTGTFDFSGNWAGASSFSITPNTATSTGFTGTKQFDAVLVGQYTVTETDPSPADALMTVSCTDGDGNSTNQGQTGIINLSDGETVTCTFTNAQLGPINIAKTVTSGPTLVSGNVYEVGYDVTVTNTSYRAEQYTLTDSLKFGGGITPISATVTPPAGVTVAPGFNGLSSTTIVSNGTIAPKTLSAESVLTFHVTVRATVAGTATSSQRDCTLSEGENGTGFLNSATVTFGESSNTATACVPAPPGNITIVKVVSAQPVRNADGTQSLTYTLTVSNEGDGPDTYTLTDLFHFPAEVVVKSATAVNTDPGNIAIVPGFNGSTQPVIATSDINPGDTHTYTVTVTADVSGVHTVDLANCSEAGEGHGYFNTATIAGVTSAIQPDVRTSSACADIPPFSDVQVLKVANPASVTWVEGDPAPQVGWDITVTNNGPMPAAGVHMTDTIPADFTAIAATPSVGTCTVTGQAIDCTIGDLDYKATATIRVTATVVNFADATVVNTANVSNTTPPDTNTGNNTSKATTTVTVQLTVTPPPPPIVNPPTPPTPELPHTGAVVAQPIMWALSLMFAGAMSMATGRRRRKSQPEA